MLLPWERLPRYIADSVTKRDGVYEIRVRLGERIEVCSDAGSEFIEGAVTPADMENIVACLTGQSVYACEEEMREGFFTVPGGARVGVTGRYARANGQLQSVSSLSVRIPRKLSDAGGLVWERITANGSVGSCLILSPPRMGKTTLLRSLIIRACEAGFHVAVADERDELAGGKSLGSLADVASNCPKRVCIPRLVRAMSPDIIATDEIGHAKDAQIIADAKRCGCTVFATAHAEGFETAVRRRTLRDAMTGGIFDYYIELRREPGHVARILDRKGGEIWTDGL